MEAETSINLLLYFIVQGKSAITNSSKKDQVAFFGNTPLLCDFLKNPSFLFIFSYRYCISASSVKAFITNSFSVNPSFL